MDYDFSDHVISVGELYNKDKKHWPEQLVFQYEQAGHILRLFLRSPSAPEIEAVREGPAEFGLFPTGDVIFFLFRFYTLAGELCVTGECPFSWWLVHEDYRALPSLTYEKGVGSALSVHLIDAENGIVKGLRVLALTNLFSKLLAKEIHQQAAREFERSAYDWQVDNAFAAYDHKRMWKAAMVTCKAGQVED